MENLLSQYSNYFTTLKEWVFALSVIPVTLIFNSTLRSLLTRSRKGKIAGPFGWEIGIGEDFFPVQLWSSVSRVIFTVGLTIFVELAPLKGRAYTSIANLTFILTVFVGLNLIQRAALLGVQWASNKAKQDEVSDSGFVPLLHNLVTIFVTLTGGIIVLKHFNYDVMSLITALGVGSLAVGLAAKDTLSNMISGFILIIDRNLKPGDRINLTGNIGDVKEIGLRSTQIRVSDGNILIVPNSDLVNNRIINLSIHSKEISSKVQIRVPCSVPFSKIKALCLQVSQQVEKIESKKPPSVNLLSLADGHQLINITIWVGDFKDSDSAVSEFNERLLARLDQEKIVLVSRCSHC